MYIGLLDAIPAEERIAPYIKLTSTDQSDITDLTT